MQQGATKKQFQTAKAAEKAHNMHGAAGKRAGVCSPGAEAAVLHGLMVLLQLSAVTSEG